MSFVLLRKDFLLEFAKTTSWQYESHYEPLGSDIHQPLGHFFEYHNELLFRLLGEDLSGRW